MPIFRMSLNCKQARHDTCVRWNHYSFSADLESLLMLTSPFRKCHDRGIESQSFELCIDISLEKFALRRLYIPALLCTS